MTRRYASHLICIPPYGYLARWAVELRDGRVERVFPCREEPEDTRWMPGIILLTDAGGEEWHTHLRPERLESVPGEVARKLHTLRAVHLYPFDFTAMKPVAGTQRTQLR